jgi:uncharacterized membrane protein YdbT with pleckstrin-like domain
MRFSLKPVFVGWITLLAQLPLQLFFTLWGGGFFGGFATSFGLFPGTGLSFIFFGSIAFVGFPLVAYFGKKLNYSRTEYKFFDDHVEFDEGFFTVNRKVVSFRYVREVTLRKGILQRTCGLGSIYLATQATGSSPGHRPFTALGFGNVSASGILVRDISEPDAAYERIRKLVDAGAGRGDN